MATQDWLQAQYSVLGAALIEPKVVPKVVHKTGPEDYTAQNKTVYSAIRNLFLTGRPVDPVTVASALGKDYQSYLMQLMEITPTAANIDQYITLCHEQARIAKAQSIAQQIAQAESWDQIAKLLDDAGQITVDKQELRVSSMDDCLRSFYDRHGKGKAEYLTWPIQELNDYVYAELGDFLIFGGYPSCGKSAWALQCAWHWAQKYRVGFFSLETSSEKLFDRQMAAVVGLSMDDIKRNTITEEGWAHVASSSTGILARNLELIPAAGFSPADIRAVTMMRRYQIILIDYVQLLQGRGENRTAQVTAISIALHTLAQSLGVTVVGLSQLTRPSKDQKGRAPEMSDLRESGQLEQDADLVMMLSMSSGDNPSGDRDLRIRKNKEGRCPSVRLAFDGAHQTFRKAQKTGDTVSRYVADGHRAQAQRKNQIRDQDQMTMLPDDTPVPF